MRLNSAPIPARSARRGRGADGQWQSLAYGPDEAIALPRGGNAVALARVYVGTDLVAG